jgi:hypothetical protein
MTTPTAPLAQEQIDARIRAAIKPWATSSGTDHANMYRAIYLAGFNDAIAGVADACDSMDNKYDQPRPKDCAAAVRALHINADGGTHRPTTKE